MTGGEMRGGRILKRKLSVICRERQGGRMCNTKDQMSADERKEGYKGMRGDKLYKLKKLKTNILES